MTKLMKKLALIINLMPTGKWSLTKMINLNRKKKMNMKMNQERWSFKLRLCPFDLFYVLANKKPYFFLWFSYKYCISVTISESVIWSLTYYTFFSEEYLIWYNEFSANKTQKLAKISISLHPFIELIDESNRILLNW